MKFKKRPVTTEAIQWLGNNLTEIESFCGNMLMDRSVDKLVISTLEGYLTVSLNDWIVRGFSSQQGVHFWPVKPDYFAEHYEEV